MSNISDPSGITGPFFGGFVEQVINPVAFPVTISIAAGTATLSWPAQTGALFYRVWCGLSQTNMRIVANNLLTNSYSLSGLSPNVQYFFQVTAVLAPQSSTASKVTTPTLPGGNVFFGFVPTQTPNSAQIQAMSSSINPGFAGSYTLAQIGGGAQYPCFAFPQSFGIPNQFSYGGFPYGMQETQVTIGGIVYNVFINPFLTHATPMIWLVS